MSQPDSKRLMSSGRTMQGCIRSEGCPGRFSRISFQVLCKHPHNKFCVPATSGTSSEDFPPSLFLAILATTPVNVVMKENSKGFQHKSGYSFLALMMTCH